MHFESKEDDLKYRCKSIFYKDIIHNVCLLIKQTATLA